MINKPIVVNLIAAPGSGKSTIAAGVFEELKWQSINAELITEFAKDKVWEENPAPFKDGSQLYLLGKQFYRMNRCRDGVDVLITDSPLCLCSFYLRKVKNPEVIVDYRSFDRVIKNLIDSFNNLDYFLTRTKKYNPKGRFQTEEESDKMASELKEFFGVGGECDYSISMKFLNGNKETINTIVQDVKEKLSRRG